MTLASLPIERIGLIAIPFYHRRGASNGCTYIRCGEVNRGGNEPYCYAQEKKCAGHVCRVICPTKTLDRCSVIRDDGTCWTIWLSNFQSVTRLEIVKEANV